MGIMNVKKEAIIILLIIGIMVVVSGCARWPYGPEPGPGTEYQLEITVEVAGEINSYEGIYYIVLDADGNSATGPFSDISLWDDRFYYIKLEDGFFYFTKVEEGSPVLQLTDSLYSGDKLEATIALSDLEDPSSVDINVVATDSEGDNYDHLDSYFTINTVLGSTEEGIISGGGTGGADFDITKVTAVVTTLY
jgi:hypothetical protein